MRRQQHLYTVAAALSLSALLKSWDSKRPRLDQVLFASGSKVFRSTEFHQLSNE